MLVSVIVPVYNVEQYLNRCVESILLQTYNNIEVILVDDGSTDKSGVMCDSFASSDARIRVIHKKNGGLSSARNEGLKRATGDFIAFVDSDDYISSTMIEHLVRDMDDYNADISSIGYCMFDDSGKPNINKSDTTEVFDKLSAIKLLFSKDKFCNFAWNKLYKKELFDNISFPVGRKMEDLGTTYLLFDKCSVITYNASSEYFYYQREDSILHKVDSTFYRDEMFLTLERYQFIKDKYGDISENVNFFLTNVFRCNDYIKDDRSFSDTIMNEVNEIYINIRELLPFKRRVKLFFFIYLPFLYKAIWRASD